jgi:hypothetical protein
MRVSDDQLRGIRLDAAQRARISIEDEGEEPVGEDDGLGPAEPEPPGADNTLLRRRASSRHAPHVVVAAPARPLVTELDGPLDPGDNPRDRWATSST